MDQDFHYYGTYYAARAGGYSRHDATVIAKASNFIDFLSNETYAGYWKIVSDTQTQPNNNYDIVGSVDYPRYTFQGNISSGASSEGGLWAAYHFMPGNSSDPTNTPSASDVHGAAVAGLLPPHTLRTVVTNNKITTAIGKLLNRPQSALSRSVIADTTARLNDTRKLEEILGCAVGGNALLSSRDKADIVKRFGLMLVGARAHVIGDTWAHQDWSATNNEINTYWDVNGSSWGRQGIEYDDIGDQWKYIVLSATKDDNLKAVPNGVCYLGHGWMGHFPDYSFAKYRYKPCWNGNNAQPHVRDNPTEYKHAFLELCSMFTAAKGKVLNPASIQAILDAAGIAISTPCDIANKAICPRVHSSEQWMKEMTKLGIENPEVEINAKLEPDATTNRSPNTTIGGKGTVLDGNLGYAKATGDLLGVSRYGTFYISLFSDFYLFSIAADYQFQFVKNWCTRNNVGADLFNNNWSRELGPIARPEGLFT